MAFRILIQLFKKKFIKVSLEMKHNNQLRRGGGGGHTWRISFYYEQSSALKILMQLLLEKMSIKVLVC